MTADDREELLDDALSTVKDIMMRKGLSAAEIGKGMVEFGRLLIKTSPGAAQAGDRDCAGLR